MKKILIRVFCRWLHIHYWEKPQKIGTFTHPVCCKRCHIFNKNKMNDYDDIMDILLKNPDLYIELETNDDRYKKLKSILNEKGENILTNIKTKKK